MVIVGIDLGNEYSQVCCYNSTMKEPESVDFSAKNQVTRIPTQILYETKDNSWLVGDDAVKSHSLGNGILYDNLLEKVLNHAPIKTEDFCVMPLELMNVLMDYLLFSAGKQFEFEKPDVVCVSLPVFAKDLLDVIRKSLTSLVGGDCKLVFCSHIEAYAYYALCQPENTAHNDIVLLDYERRGLSYCRLVTRNSFGKQLVLSEYKDLSEEVPFDDNKSMEEALLSVVKREFDHKNISTVYLTGDGFDREFAGSEFLSFVCNRRRAFAGQNIFAKGACYLAFEENGGERFKNTVFCCNERITTGIELKISDRGTDKILRLIKPGVNWYLSGCQYDFILDGCENMEFFLSPVDSGEKKKLVLSLEGFPIRENKTTRVTLSLSFSSDSKCHLSIADKGFGEIVKSSGKILSEDFEL